MLLDVLADFIAVFVGHDDVGDDHVGPGLFDLGEGAGSIMAGDDVDVLAAEGDLDDLAHGGAVVNEIDGGCRTHSEPPADISFSPSSSSRRASSMSSVAERSTVRVVAVAPGTNLYTPLSLPLQLFTM